MLVSMVGVYGTMAYAVRQREREIAIRMAMGARRGHVVGMFLREGAVVILTGLLLGLSGALAAGRLLESQLFGVQPGDPTTIAAAVAVLGGVALAAVWWPSRRAASTDPAVALRVE
jgi:ABC-type antimicrobial peptide transport system permease subunit